MEKFPLNMREQTTGEEIANSFSHGAGLIAVIVATPFLVINSSRIGDSRDVFGAVVFAVTMAFLYFSSALYHALPHGKVKRAFRVIEHAAIFLLIAGTYTPFVFGVLRTALGWTLLSLVWLLALVGVALKIFARLSPFLNTALYLLMGWLALIAIKPMYDGLPTAGFYWLLGGGAAYTLGVIFFATDDDLRYGHFVWHLFVMAGTLCHYFAILWYVI